MHAGDIGVVAKLKNSHTNDTLTTQDRPVVLQQINFPEPDIALAVRAASRSDEDKIGAVWQSCTRRIRRSSTRTIPELRQTIIRGLGELHLDVQMERLKRKYHVEVVTEEPRIPYRETFRKAGGGAGQVQEADGRTRPVRRLPRPDQAAAARLRYRFTDAITGGVIPNKFIPSVDKGIQESAKKGMLAGYPVVDFEAECYFGSYHTVDSSDIAFQIAGSMAFQKAAESASPVILEPIVEVEVVTPESYMGDVIGDLNHRRGKILGMEQDGPEDAHQGAGAAGRAVQVRDDAALADAGPGVPFAQAARLRGSARERAGEDHRGGEEGAEEVSA
jgi:elongation factor G